MAYQLPDEIPGASEKEKDNEVGLFASALAGVFTGVVNIPKGFVSLGAEVFDLVGDTDSAASVDKWFDDLNPWDDEAEARTIGRVTQALAQVAPLGVGGYIMGAKYGSKVARRLAKRAIAAKKANKAFGMTNFGRKIAKTGMGVVGGGAAEMIVADEDIGTFADMLQGTSLEGAAVTMMDRETKEGRSEAYRRLMNRVKFGTEGALFNLGIIGAGKGIKKLRTPAERGLNAYSDNPLVKILQKYGVRGLKPEGTGSKYTFELGKEAESEISAVGFKAMEEGKNLTKLTDKIFPAIENNFLARTGRKMTAVEKTAMEAKFFKDIDDLLRVEGTNAKSILKSSAIRHKGTLLRKRRALVAKANPRHIEKLRDQLKVLNAKTKTILYQDDLVKHNKKIARVERELKEANQAFDVLKKIDQEGGGVFKIRDYDVNLSPQWKNIVKQVEGAGGNASKLADVIKNMRAGIDNMSARLLGREMPDDVADILNKQIGQYVTNDYRLFMNLGRLARYKPNLEQLRPAIDTRYKQLFDMPENAYRTREGLQKQAHNDVYRFLKSQGVDELSVSDLKAGGKNADVRDVMGQHMTKTEVEALQIDPNILKPRVLEEWQRIAAGQVHDPRYTFYSTVMKQARLNANTKFLNKIYQMGSKGRNKFIFTEEELKAHPVLKGHMNNTNRFKKVSTGGKQIEGLSPMEGLYIRAPYYDAIFDVSNNALKNSMVGQFYKYAILAPKGISQVTKTILSALTHVRNFISAGAFAAANGIFWPDYGNLKTLFGTGVTGDKSLIKTAWDLTGKRVAGKMPKASQELYERLLRVQGVGTQVQAGEMRQLIGDAFGATDDAARDIFGKTLDKNYFGKAVRRSREVYGRLQDAYVAEDDFWKILTWGVERNRYSGMLTGRGINKTNFNRVLNGDKNALVKEFGEGADKLQNFLNKSVKRNYNPRTRQYAGNYEQFLDEIAGDMVRNQVPNYAYIGRTGKALRYSPFGNFIAFPLEVIRTGNNIYEQAIKEMTSGIPEIAALGKKRMFSFAATTIGVPYGIQQAFKSKNDVTDEEMTALKRFVPEWSKNSTLLPTGRDEDGYLKYIDFSYSNAYDTLIRPFNAIMRELSEGQGTEASLMKALGNGITEATMDTLEPFMSESIYTEAFFDATIRRGIGLKGKRVWSPADDNWTRIVKGISHIGSSFKPGSTQQFRRLHQAVRGVSDEYGRTFKLEDEIGGLAGFRQIQVDPERGMIFKTTRFSSSLKKAENLFTSDLLKGGRVSADDIIDRYKYSENRRFQTLKEMHIDIEAARVLGMSNAKIRNKIKRRGLSTAVVNEVMKGVYTPKRPSDFFRTKIAQITRELNEAEGRDLDNPYFEALPTIIDIINNNRRINLKEETPKMLETVEEFSKGGRVGMREGGDIENVKEINEIKGISEDRVTASQIWKTEPDQVKQMYDYDFNKYYASGAWIEKIEALEQAPEQAPVSKQPLPPTPSVDPKVMKDPMVNTNLMQTGLTQTEQALLSNEEKSIRLRQRGLSR